jgi:hypothetical protein
MVRGGGSLVAQWIDDPKFAGLIPPIAVIGEEKADTYG